MSQSVNIEQRPAFSLASFHNRKNEVVAALSQLSIVARRLHSSAVSSQVDLMIRDLDSDIFRLVVVGEFSHGKSTVINALVGEEILPSSVQPTTAVLSTIAAGKECSYTLHYHGGATRTIDAEEFARLVAPDEPDRRDQAGCERYEATMRELRSISVACILHPSAFCTAGVEVVDTPGTNDLDPLREQITYEFVPRSDAVLFVLSARRILAQTEIDFLRDRILKADIQRIFFLVNFADVLSDRDYQRVRDYALNHLAPLVANPRLYMVSARRELRAITASETTATPSGFRELKRDLGRFLAEERGAFKMRRPLARGLRFCEELLRGPLALARNSIGLDLPDLKRRIETLTPQIRQLESERDACLAQLETALTNRRLELEHELRMGLNNVAHTAVNAVHKYGTRQNGPLKRQELARYLEQQIAPVQTAFQSRFAERQANALRDGSETVQQRSRDAFQSLDRSVQEIFAVCEAQPAFSTLDAPEAPQEQVDLAKPVGVAIGIAALGLSVFLPLAVLAGWVGSMLFRGWSDNKARLEALEQIRLEVDQRYRASIPAAVADFEKHWDETAKRMGASLKADFNRRRDEVRFQLTDAVAAHEGSVRSADERRLELDEIARQLEQIRNLLVAQQS